MLHEVHLIHPSQSSSLEERTTFKCSEAAQRPKKNFRWLYSSTPI